MSALEPEQQHHPSREAAEAAVPLRARAAAVAARWEALGSTVPRDRMDALLAQLAMVLEDGGIALDGAGLTGDHASLVREYGRLRRALVEVLGADLTSGAAAALHQRLDATLTRAVETASRAEAELLETIEQADPYFLLDPEWRLIRVNRSQERISGKPRSETLGRTIWEIWPELEDPRTAYWQNYQRCMNERVPVTFDDYYAPLDVWTEVSAYPVREGGIAVFFRDATPRKRAELAMRHSEKQLRQLFDAMSEGFAICDIVLDADGKPYDYLHLRVNPAFTRLSGGRFTPEFAQGKTARELAPNVEQYWIDLFGEVALTGRSAGRLDYVAALDRWFDTRAYSLGGRRFAYVYADVTKEKKAEQALQEVNARLVEAHRRKDELIGMMSHDLRSPLGAARMTAGVLLKREGHDERTVKGLVRIQSSLERAMQLIETLLDFTHARLGGNIPVEKTPTPLDELVRQVIDDAQANYPERELRLSGGPLGEASVDPLRIGQVLQNLVVNALKYSAPGTPVEVRLVADATHVSFQVHNLGEPIPAALQSRLFQPMQRGERAAGSGEPGLGLGLFIVDQLVRAHGGTVEVRSVREDGTTFTVRLPRSA